MVVQKCCIYNAVPLGLIFGISLSALTERVSISDVYTIKCSALFLIQMILNESKFMTGATGTFKFVNTKFPTE